MCRLRFVEPEEADAFTRKLLKQVGIVPNLFCILANSGMVLDAFLTLNANLDAGETEKKYRKMAYLATSQLNECSYCLASHTSTPMENNILTKEECLDARRMKSDDPRAQAVLQFTREVLEQRGKVSDEVLAEMRQQDFHDAQIMEILGTIVLAIFSNYTASVARPELDFLEAPPLESEET